MRIVAAWHLTLIDPLLKEFVVLDKTDWDLTFHGHVRSWDELRPSHKAELIKNFGFSSKGKLKR